MIIEHTQTVKAQKRIVPKSLEVNQWFYYRAEPRFTVTSGMNYEPQDIIGLIVHARLDGYIGQTAMLTALVRRESVKPGRWL